MSCLCYIDGHRSVVLSHCAVHAYLVVCTPPAIEAEELLYCVHVHIWLLLVIPMTKLHYKAAVTKLEKAVLSGRIMNKSVIGF